MMVFTFLYLLPVATYFASSQSIDPNVARIDYTTGSNFGGDSSTLTITVNWNGVNFVCSTNPNRKNKNYNCGNPSSSSGTSNPSIEYYVTLDWPQNSASLQISELMITDDTGSTYTMTRFCVGSLLQHTLDNAEGSAASQLNDCDQWQSKKSYSNLHLGGDSKFTKLHVDIPIFASRFANKVVEGGVRPPDLQNVALLTAGAGVSDTVTVSIQWDIVLYRCTIASPNAAQTQYQCSISETVYCPGIETGFWVSIYNPNTEYGILTVDDIILEDETATIYTLADFCEATNAISDVECPSNAAYFDVETIAVGSVYHENLLPFFAYESLYNYPDTISTEHMAVDTDTTFSHGWDTTQNQYGGTVTPECPATPKPTYDPTKEPTYDPTKEPTIHPTSAPSDGPTFSPTDAPTDAPSSPPTRAPTDNPTLNPTYDPTADPTLDPTYDPTADPTIDPTIDPTLDPTIDPTVDPTIDPTLDPTVDPTTEPTKYPTTEPTFLPTRFPTQEPTTHEPTWTRNPTEEPTEHKTILFVNDKDKTPAPSQPVGENTGASKSSGFSDWIAQNWIFIPVAIGALCLILCLVVVFAIRNNKDLLTMMKNQDKDAEEPHVEQTEAHKAAAVVPSAPIKSRKKKKKKHATTGAPNNHSVQQQDCVNEFAQIMAKRKAFPGPKLNPKISLTYSTKSEGPKFAQGAHLDGILAEIEADAGNTHGEGQSSLINGGNAPILHVMNVENDEEVIGSELGDYTTPKKKKKNKKRSKKNKNILYSVDPRNDAEIVGNDATAAGHNKVIYNLNPLHDDEVIGSEMGQATDIGQKQAFDHVVAVTDQNGRRLQQLELEKDDDDVIIGGINTMTLGDLVVSEPDDYVDDIDILEHAIAQPPMVTGSMIDRMNARNSALVAGDGPTMFEHMGTEDGYNETNDGYNETDDGFNTTKNGYNNDGYWFHE